jgi:hypothetical protein
MSNYIISNLRKPSDYLKAAMNQDQLLKLAIANDANIAQARNNIKLGVDPVQLTIEQSKSPDELQMDTSKQYSDALANLQDLGFRYREAGEIVSDMTDDERFKLNSVYPAIKKDVTSRFNPKLITPTFFLEYLRQYLQELDNTKGLSATSGTAYITGKFNALIDNVNELRSLFPTQGMIDEFIAKSGAALNRLPAADRALFRDNLVRIRNSLPDDSLYRSIQALQANDPVEADRLIQILQTNLANMPTRDTIQMYLDQNTMGLDRIEALVDSLTDEQERKLDEINSTLGLVASQVGSPAPKRGAVTTPPSIEFETSIGTIGLDGQRFVIEDSTGDWVRITKPELQALIAPIPNSNSFKRAVTDSRGNIDLMDLRRYIRDNAGSTAGFTATTPTKPAGGASSSASVTSGTTAPASSTTGGSGLIKNSKIKVKKIGKGIQADEEPKYREFGKYVLHYPQLVNNDILNIKYKSLGGVPNIPVQKVSELYKDFLTELVENGKANGRLYERLPEQEKYHFEKISTGAGLFHKLGLKKSSNDISQKEYEHFQILRGEYLAGNNNLQLIRQLKNLAIKFMNEGRIPKRQAYDLLLELSLE